MGRAGRLVRVLPDYARHAFVGLVVPALGGPPPCIAQAVVRSERGVLLAMRRSLRGWELPGGGVEPGETAQQALCREVLEETGIAVEAGRLVGEYQRTGFRPHTALVFECHARPDPPRGGTGTARVAWFDPAHLPSTLFPWFRGPLLDALAGHPAPVRRREHQGWRAILAGLRIDLAGRLEAEPG